MDAQRHASSRGSEHSFVVRRPEDVGSARREVRRPSGEWKPTLSAPSTPSSNACATSAGRREKSSLARPWRVGEVADSQVGPQGAQRGGNQVEVVVLHEHLRAVRGEVRDRGGEGLVVVDERQPVAAPVVVDRQRRDIDQPMVEVPKRARREARVCAGDDPESIGNMTTAPPPVSCPARSIRRSGLAAATSRSASDSAAHSQTVSGLAAAVVIAVASPPPARAPTSRWPSSYRKLSGPRFDAITTPGAGHGRSVMRRCHPPRYCYSEAPRGCPRLNNARLNL